MGAAPSAPPSVGGNARRRRHLIITYGPAGSGKGHVAPHYEAELRRLYPAFTPEQGFQRVGRLLGGAVDGAAATEDRLFVAEIDNYIESDEIYINEAKQRTATYRKECRKSRRELTDCMRRERQLTDELVRDLSDLYFRVRTKYDEQLTHDLRSVIEAGWHVVFETTGTGSLDWLLRMVEEQANYAYVISIVFPAVDDAVVMARIQERFLNRAVCVEDVNCAPPRLPDAHVVREGIATSRANLLRYAVDPRVHHIFLYNNNEGCTQRPGGCLRVDLRNVDDIMELYKLVQAVDDLGMSQLLTALVLHSLRGRRHKEERRHGASAPPPTL